MTTIEVLDVGTELILGPKGETFSGTITAISIRGRGTKVVEYEVSWFNGRAWNSAWIPEYLVVVPRGPMNLQIGFQCESSTPAFGK